MTRRCIFTGGSIPRYKITGSTVIYYVKFLPLYFKNVVFRHVSITATKISGPKMAKGVKEEQKAMLI